MQVQYTSRAMNQVGHGCGCKLRKQWKQDKRGLLLALLVSGRSLIRFGIKITVTRFSGVCIGLNAAMISIVTEWLSTIKLGYCTEGWWLSQQFCCWEIEGDEDSCHSW